MRIEKPGLCLTLFAATTCLALSAFAKPAQLPGRSYRLDYRDLARQLKPKDVAFNPGSTRYGVAFSQKSKGQWAEQWSSPRYAQTSRKGPFRLAGEIWAHDGRARTSVRTDGTRVTPYTSIPISIEGTIPRKGSKAKRSDLPWVTVLPINTEMAAIRKLAQQEGWNKEGVNLELGAVKVRYSTDGNTWKNHTEWKRGGDVVLSDVKPQDRLFYEVTVPVRAASLGGRQFEGEKSVFFKGQL